MKIMNKQIFFGFVIIAAAAIMLTSQIPEAYAAETVCDSGNPLLSGDINTNIIVSAGSPFNTCVIDGATITGNIVVGENAAVFVINGATIRGNIELNGKFSAINFEGIDINNLLGNILAIENTYVFIESLNMDGNVDSKGEVYASSSSNRFSGPVVINGNIIIEKTDNTDEFVIAGATISGNVMVKGQLSIRISDANIGGNVEIIENENTSSVDSTISIGFNTIGGNVNLAKNKFSDPSSIFLLTDNTMGGDLILLDNDSDITIENNTIAGSTDCKGNKNISGSLNTVVGAKSEQCIDI